MSSPFPVSREPLARREQPRPAPLRTVGDYTLLSKIGEGGMGVVHLARRPEGPRVALKVLRPHIVGDEEARARLAREVGSLRRIRSRWVAEIVDADPWAEVPYVATRYVPGLSLHDHVVEEGVVDGRDLVWFATCLAQGVESVHDVGVLHRDIKPSNVLMEGRTPILIDFGLARVADDPRLTHTGWLLGTPGYLAPEILYGEDATPASDVHSWAATVAFAGTGAPPFGRGPSMAVMDRVRRGEHDLGDLHGAVRDLVDAALDPEPWRRPTLEEVIAELHRRTGPRPVRGPVPAPVEDEFTLPLALAAQAHASDPTDVVSPEPATPTRLETVVTRPEPPRSPYDRPAAPVPWDPAPGGLHPLEHPPEHPVEPRVGAAERLRRGLLAVGLGAVATAGVAAYPWPTLALLAVLVWLLRSGSLAVSAAGERRALRGRRWYDGPRLLLAAPWHLTRSVPGTVLLVLWSGGLAVAAGLVGYAVAASGPVILGLAGAVLVLSLWWGPGGSRVRSPIGRVVRPLARSAGSWLAALLVVLVAGGVLGVSLADHGTRWTPAQDRPLVGRLP